jgi:hypothetical protein
MLASRLLNEPDTDTSEPCRAGDELLRLLLLLSSRLYRSANVPRSVDSKSRISTAQHARTHARTQHSAGLADSLHQSADNELAAKTRRDTLQ